MLKHLVGRPVQRIVRQLVRPRQRLARMKFRLLRVSDGLHLYQPVPWLGFEDAPRAQQTHERWAAIERELVTIGLPGSAIDLGSQLGYFSLRLAEAGWLCLAVEGRQATHEAATLIQQATGLSNVAYKNMSIDSKSIATLPRADVVVFLSLWHHLCRAEGIDAAKDLLKSVLDRTNVVCFFETGQSTESYEAWAETLPSMAPDPVAWISRLLIECGASEVRLLGHFGTFLGPVQRPLFAAYTQRSARSSEEPVQAAVGATSIQVGQR